MPVRKHVIKAKIKPEYPNPISDVMINKVREMLWKNPELIDEYINEIELPQEKINILKLWRTNHKKGMVIIFEYQPDYAVAIAPDEEAFREMYNKAIKHGIITSLE